MKETDKIKVQVVKENGELVKEFEAIVEYTKDGWVLHFPEAITVLSGEVIQFNYLLEL